MPIAHRLLGPDPVVDLDDALRRTGAGHALWAARHRSPDSIIDVVTAARLRGRGGAGFPTGWKWRSVLRNATSPPPIVVNAAEGEPGTFKDRLLIRSNPYLVLEGACIAARAMGSDEIVVAVKASFEREIERLRQAIDEIETAGWVAPGTIRLVAGPSEYLFGEDTALLEVIEGRPPFPRVVPSYRYGLDLVGPADAVVGNTPALVNNVETLANVPGILRHGADWYRGVGTTASPGTVLCTVSGATARHGVAEFTMGTSLREVIETIGVEVPEIGVVLVGVSSPPLTPDQLDIPLAYESLAAAGSGLGSASFIVVDAATSLHDVAAGVARFLSIESCGQCTPCKHDGLDIAAGLLDGDDRLVASRLGTVARGARCALARQTEHVVGRLVELAGEQRTGTPYPIAPLVDLVGGRAVLDEAHLRKRPDWSYDGEEPDSHLDPRRRYADAPVTIRRPHRREPARGATRAARPVDDRPLFAAVHDADERIEATLAAIRAADVAARAELTERLRHDLERHHDAVERFVYPLLERVDPSEGTDVAWYPRRHEALAEQFLTGDGRPDDLEAACDELHITVLELERRVLPLLEQELGPRRGAAVDDAVRSVLEASR